MNIPETSRYDPLSRWLHWGMAIMLFSMIGLGFYSTTLTYYDPLYHRAVFWHRSLGVLVMGVLLVRIAWRLTHTPPPLPEEMPAWERFAALATHRLLYLLMVLLPVSGYLLSTADGRGVSVFGWFEFPALLPAAKGREDWAGMLHLMLAVLFCALLALHLLAVFKHHFIQRDGILRRMW